MGQQNSSSRQQSTPGSDVHSELGAGNEIRFDPVDTDADELQLAPLQSELPELQPEDSASPEIDFEPFAEAIQEPTPLTPLEVDEAEAGLPDSEALVQAMPVTAPTAQANEAVHANEAAQANDEPDVRERQLASSAKRRFFLAAAPSWLISLMVHLVLLLALAAVTLDPLQSAISVLQASVSQNEAALEEFDIQGPTLDSPSDQLDAELAVPDPTLGQVVSLPDLQSPMMASFDTQLDSLEMNSITESILPTSALKSSAMAQISVALNSRSSAAKSEMLEKFGGNAASEKAVAMALKWIAGHQATDGGWNFTHSAICGNQCKDSGDLFVARNGATAMALLPFLGAGQTHIEGQYKDVVKRGLAYLINRMQVSSSGGLPVGSWHEPGGRMYSHGLAAITVCEAYAMTGDPDLQQAAQLSLNYLITAQDTRGGGWRYVPGSPGDTSVVGWCLMALKSGKMGRLSVPDATFQGADRFLTYASVNNGAYFGYTKPESDLDRVQTTTAVGLLCRMYLGYPKEHRGMQEGIKFLSERGPKLNDLYYSYYATQIMRHHGGPLWEKWNAEMRDQLIAEQEQKGHAAGSWHFGGAHSSKGGRLYSTSLAAMILEVYYRHMPLYSERSSDDDFKI